MSDVTHRWCKSGHSIVTSLSGNGRTQGSNKWNVRMVLIIIHFPHLKTSSSTTLIQNRHLSCIETSDLIKICPHDGFLVISLILKIALLAFLGNSRAFSCLVTQPLWLFRSQDVASVKNPKRKTYSCEIHVLADGSSASWLPPLSCRALPWRYQGLANESILPLNSHPNLLWTVSSYLII